MGMLEDQAVGLTPDEADKARAMYMHSIDPENYPDPNAPEPIPMFGPGEAPGVQSEDAYTNNVQDEKVDDEDPFADAERVPYSKKEEQESEDPFADAERVPFSPDAPAAESDYVDEEDPFAEAERVPLKPPMPAPVEAEEEGGYLDAAVGGIKKAYLAVKTEINSLLGDAEAVEKLAAESQGIKGTKAQEDFGKALKANSEKDETLWDGVSNVLSAAYDQPLGASHEMVAQAGNMAPILGGAYVGMKAGAATGLVVGGPVGAIVGGVVGSVAGMFAGNMAIEGGFAQQEEALKPGMITQKQMSEANIGAAKKAAVITGIDMITMGANRIMMGAPGRAASSAVTAHLVAKGVDVTDDVAVRAALNASPELLGEVMEISARTMADATGTVIGKKGARAAAGMGLETVGEGTGEYLGTLASGKEASFTEAALEAFMAGPTSAAELAFTSTYKMGKAGAEKLLGPTKEAAADLESDMAELPTEEEMIVEQDLQAGEAAARASDVDAAMEETRQEVLDSGGDLLQAELAASQVNEAMGQVDNEIRAHLSRMQQRIDAETAINAAKDKAAAEREKQVLKDKKEAETAIKKSKKGIEEDKAYEQRDKVSGIGQTGDVGYIAESPASDETVAGEKSGGVVRGNQLAEAFAKAANVAATSPQNDLPPPTPAQIEAGNYKKGHKRIAGLDITIENPAGSTREAADGSWKQDMKDHYGYIKGTESAEGKTEKLDVFVGEKLDSDQVFVVDQINKDGSFDEHKVMMGYGNAVEARRAYARNYPHGFRVGKITPMSTQKFKEWLKNGDQTQPVANAGGPLADVAGQQKEVIQPKTLDGERTTRTLTAAEQAEQRIEQMPGRKVRYRLGEGTITDEKGTPINMYHGSPRQAGGKGIARFRASKNDGIYFSSDPQYAGGYAKEFRAAERDKGFDAFDDTGAVYQTELSTQNPLVINEGDPGFAANLEKYQNRGFNKQQLQKDGYDAVVIKYNDGEIEAMVLEPSQVKSVAGKGKKKVRYRLEDIEKQPKSPALKKFLEGSTVQTPVFHGTLAPNIKSFRRGAGGLGTHVGTVVSANDRLTWKRADAHNIPEDEAIPEELKSRPLSEEEPTGQNIMPVYISLKNPLRIERDTGFTWPKSFLEVSLPVELRDKLPKEWLKDPTSPEKGDDWLTKHERTPDGFRVKDKGISLKDIRKWLQGLGYDGIAYRNDVEDRGSTSYILFEPSQIKSAVGNRGTYNPKDKRILYRLEDQVDAEEILSKVQKDGDGFTIDNATGKAKKSGFAAGIGMEKQFKELPTAKDIDEYRKAHADALAEPGNYLGGWMDGGVFFLDVSKVYPNNDMGRKRAYEAAKSRGEYGIQDLSKPPEEGYIPIEYAEGEMEAIRAAAAKKTVRYRREEADGDKYFDDQAFRDAESSTLVHMSPDEFLSMAERMSRQDEQKKREIGMLIDEGVGLNSIPLLTFQEDGKVKGHEGRHRALALKAKGVKSMPVRMIGKGTPATLKGQSGGSMPFPTAPATQEEAPHEGRAFKNFFSAVTKGLTGTSSTGAAYKPVISAVADNMGRPGSPIHTYSTEYMKHRGKFDDHIAFSIPGYKEVQQAVGAAIAQNFGPGQELLDIGASEGSFAKAVTAISGMKSTSLDPNPDMERSFNDVSSVPGAEYSMTALGAADQEGEQAWVEDDGTAIEYFDPMGKKYDVVHEAMVFQFVSNERQEQIARVKELVSADGLFITEEKLFTDNQAENEAKKNKDHKALYFEKKDLDAKSAEVLEGMHKNMVKDSELEAELLKNFKYVMQFWDSGNFKGYMASDSRTTLDNVINSMPSLKSDFATTSTPRAVSTGNTRLRQGGAEPVVAMTSAKAKTLVAPILKKMPAIAPKILANPSEAPAELRAQMERDNAMKAKGVFDPESGELFIFSENHDSDADLVRTLLHEGVAHKGLRVLLGDKFDAVMKDVFENGDRAEMDRIARRYGLDPKNAEDKVEIAEEYIAFMAENDVKSTVLQRVVAAIRRLFRAIGPVKEWSDNDIQGLLRRSRRGLKGKPMRKAMIKKSFILEGTGEIVEVETSAEVELRNIQKRKEACERLRKCIR